MGLRWNGSMLAGMLVANAGPMATYFVWDMQDVQTSSTYLGCWPRLIAKNASREVGGHILQINVVNNQNHL